MQRDIMYMRHLFGVFFLFFFCSYEAVCMGFHTSAIADPPMGIITVSCKGSVLLRNTQSAVLSLVFPVIVCFQSFLQGKLNDLV